MGVHDHPEFRDHEDVVFCRDAETGTSAIIAVHSTRLGPAAGGCRMLDYGSEEEALRDVLRLSYAMTHKNAVAGLPLGGGKSVVLADPHAPGKQDRLRAVARHIARLGGLYWSAIDVGVGPEDAEAMKEENPYVFAAASQFTDGDSCETYTALGGLAAIRAAISHVLGSPDLAGVRVAVQGVGQVGMDICRRLKAEGAVLTVADIDEEAMRKAVEEFGATAVAPNEIYGQDVDLLAPCALGGVLNDGTIPRIRARAICGMANNQLAEPRHDAALAERGIVWAPDYVANAGGMLGASGPVYGETDQESLRQRVIGIGDRMAAILDRARAEGMPPGAIADAMASERLAAG